ncbi:MAG: hypothetical protein MZV49_12980 [Rhodopseudomonas palustris]|nr:hypothetical protein [Rhodopseudomonas palustris]
MTGLPGNPTTDGSGQYSALVEHGWSGTVTPTLVTKVFSPTTRSYASVGGPVSGQDYISVVLPTLSTTSPVSPHYAVAASVEGAITDSGGAPCTGRGSCWNTTGSPTTADSHTTESGSFGTGTFSSLIEGLTASTTYHVRSYAVNPAGTAYGNDVEFTTSSRIPQAERAALVALYTATAETPGRTARDGRHRRFTPTASRCPAPRGTGSAFW